MRWGPYSGTAMNPIVPESDFSSPWTLAKGTVFNFFSVIFGEHIFLLTLVKAGGT